MPIWWALFATSWLEELVGSDEDTGAGTRQPTPPPPPRHPLALLGWVYLISFLSVNWVSLSLLRGEIRWASITK